MDWIKAHAKFIPPLVAAIVVFFVDESTADEITVAVAAILTLVVPNDQAAVDRIYHRDRRG